MTTSDSSSTSTAKTTTSDNSAVQDSSLLAVVQAARADLGDDQYISVNRCADWLLDCLNAAEGSERDAVLAVLPTFVNGNLRTAKDFIDALDAIAPAVNIGVVDLESSTAS